MRNYIVKAFAAMAVYGAINGAFGPSVRAEDAAPAASVPARDQAFWDALMTHMQLAAQAQRDLKAVTVADHDKLKQLADAAMDPDIKAQLLARLSELDEELVLNPAPISVELKNASFVDVADALKKILHVPIDTWPPRGNGGANATSTYTLSCQNKSFWQVFTQLSDQHPLRLQSYDGMRLEQGEPGLHRFFPAASGFAAFPMTLTRTKTVDGQKPAAEQVGALQLIFNYSIAADPRVAIVRYAPPVLTEVKDDAGNNLLIGEPDRQSNLWDNQPGQCIFEQNTTLAAPANIGKKIVSAKGQARFLVQLAEDRIEVDPKEVLKKPITVGSSIATISEFKVNNKTINFQVQSQGDGQSDNIGMAFVDANGKIVWSTRLNGGTGGGVGGDFVEPVKVRFSIARKTKLLTIPFEMTDLPIP